MTFLVQHVSQSLRNMFCLSCFSPQGKKNMRSSHVSFFVPLKRLTLGTEQTSWSYSHFLDLFVKSIKQQALLFIQKRHRDIVGGSKRYGSEPCQPAWIPLTSELVNTQYQLFKKLQSEALRKTPLKVYHGGNLSSEHVRRFLCRNCAGRLTQSLKLKPFSSRKTMVAASGHRSLLGDFGGHLITWATTSFLLCVAIEWWKREEQIGLNCFVPP